MGQTITNPQTDIHK